MAFYLVDDSEHPQPAFQQAIIDAVAKVTHIAPADDKGEIIGSPVVGPGVIAYPLKELGLCASITEAPYKTTTEVYPDSPNATPQQCNRGAGGGGVCGDRFCAGTSQLIGWQGRSRREARRRPPA